MGAKASSAGPAEASGAGPALAGKAGQAGKAFKFGPVVEPEGRHEASVVLLHGLGDSSAYWRPFLECLRGSGASVSGIRWLPLDAPLRVVWGERTAAWFEYITNRDGEDTEDEINEADLTEMRAALHVLVQEEAARLEAAGGLRRVLLVGSSQGGSMALDAALTLPGQVAGVAMLRSLALGATAKALKANGRGAGGALPLLAVSGREDQTFNERLVRQQLAAVKSAVALSHSVLDGLDHDTEYDTREVAMTLTFMAERLELGLDRPVDPEALARLLPRSSPGSKRWDSLSEAEQRLAAQMGIRSAKAWDDGTAAVWGKAWRDLSNLERDAAAALGFREHSWNDMGKEVADDDTPAREKSWASLSESERKIAAQLGIKGANAWDSGTAPVWSKSWRKLSTSQCKAAERLGWDQRSWDEQS